MAVAPVTPPSSLFYPYTVTGPVAGPGNSVRSTAQSNQLGNWMSAFNTLNPPTTGGVTAPTTLRTAKSAVAKPAPTMSVGTGSEGNLKGTTPGTTTPSGAPPYDMSQVNSLAQRIAAPSIRSLRTAVQDVQQGVYDNPNVKAMTVRQALAGYGQGLESAVGGSLSTAANIYNVPYQAQAQSALQANQIASNQKMQSNQIAATAALAQYQNLFQAYLQSLV